MPVNEVDPVRTALHKSYDSCASDEILPVSKEHLQILRQLRGRAWIKLPAFGNRQCRSLSHHWTHVHASLLDRQTHYLRNDRHSQPGHDPQCERPQVRVRRRERLLNRVDGEQGRVGLPFGMCEQVEVDELFDRQRR